LKSQIYLGHPQGAGAGVQADAQVLGAHGLFILHPLNAKTDSAITVPITIFFIVSPFIKIFIKKEQSPFLIYTLLKLTHKVGEPLR
jgi:hypothetical protein